MLTEYDERKEKNMKRLLVTAYSSKKSNAKWALRQVNAMTQSKFERSNSNKRRCATRLILKLEGITHTQLQAKLERLAYESQGS